MKFALKLVGLTTAKASEYSRLEPSTASKRYIPMTLRSMGFFGLLKWEDYSCCSDSSKEMDFDMEFLPIIPHFKKARARGRLNAET